ncbi:MAG: prolyl oligopeptidase family serine peptidase, partial [Parvularculaceae bacterium]
MKHQPAMAALALFFTATGGAFAQEKTPFTLDDIHKIADVSEPVFSPDGREIVYTLSTHDLKADKTVSDLWRVNWASGAVQQITKTQSVSEWSPRFSRDGKQLAFLSDAGEDEETQLWVMPATGGKARQITRIPDGVGEFALSPDGARAVVVAEAGANVGHKGDTTPPIVIDRFLFKSDGRGYLDDRRKHLFLVDLAKGEAQQLTKGEFDCAFPDWSPDGALISFVSKRGGDADRHSNFDIFVVAPEPGAEPQRLGQYDGADNDPDSGSRPSWSPDGKKVVWVRAGADKWIYYSPFQPVIGDVVTGATDDVAHIDRWFYTPRFSPAGDALYVLIEEDRTIRLARIDPATDAIDYLTPADRFAYDYALGPNGEVAVLDGDPTRPYELRAIAPEPRALTRHNEWLEGRRLGETRAISVKSGREVIHGFYVLPPDYAPGKSYPTIVRVHGGPVYQFYYEFMTDWQVYAANGYVVLAVNPRGSSGRGFDFARVIYADWGD